LKHGTHDLQGTALLDFHALAGIAKYLCTFSERHSGVAGLGGRIKMTSPLPTPKSVSPGLVGRLAFEIESKVHDVTHFIGDCSVDHAVFDDNVYTIGVDMHGK
jgi:hypothetical protein